MPQIVFIASNEFHPWGGSEALWAAAAEKLAIRGARVTVSVKNWGKPVKQIEKLRALGCHISYRAAPSFLRRAARRLPPWRNFARSYLAKIATGADLVVISQSMYSDGLPWMDAARSCNLKYAVIAQTLAECWWPDDVLAERLAAAYEAAAVPYFVSEANRDLCRRQLVTPMLHARVARNPFNVRYDSRLAWPSDSSAELRIACVGRLDVVQKSQDLLLAVLALPHWRERAVQLSLVGSGVNERALRRSVAGLKLASVTFSGFVENIEEVWRAHHALVLPSRYEGMPLALVEAMLCARPAIATDVGGVCELLRDGVNGFLVKAPTIELLDEAMNRAWENRDHLKEMGEQAALDVRSFASPDPAEDFARELLALANGQSK